VIANNVFTSAIKTYRTYVSIFMIFSVKKLFKFSASIILVFSTSLSWAQSTSPSVEGTMPEDFLSDLKVIINAALRQSPQMISSEIQISQAELNRVAVAAQRLPGLSSSASFAWSRITSDLPQPVGGFIPGQPTTNQDVAYGPYYSVNAGQSLFTWFQVTNQLKIADIAIKISQKNYADAYAGLAGLIRSQYLGLIFQKVNLRNQRFNLKQTARLLALDEQRLKNGEMAPAQLIQPRIAYAALVLAMDQSENLYKSSMRRVARLAGMESINEEAIPLEVPKLKIEANAPATLAAIYQRDGVESTFQGQVNALRIKEADLNYKITSTRLLPRIGISVSAAKYNSSTVTATAISQTAAFSTSASIGGTWTIFDGFATRAAKLSVLANKRALVQQQKNLSAQISDQLENTVKFISFLSQTLEMTEAARYSSAVNLDRVREEFKLGSVTEDAVTSSMIQLHEYDTKVVSARADLMIRWCELVSLVCVDPVLTQIPARYVH
jgi:outer membrane protein TolC